MEQQQNSGTSSHNGKCEGPFLSLETSALQKHYSFLWLDQKEDLHLCMAKVYLPEQKQTPHCTSYA